MTRSRHALASGLVLLLTGPAAAENPAADAAYDRVAACISVKARAAALTRAPVEQAVESVMGDCEARFVAWSRFLTPSQVKPERRKLRDEAAAAVRRGRGR